MDTPHDRVDLTADEQRTFSALEDVAGPAGRRLRLSMILANRTACLRSRRARDAGAALVFVAGVALMVATFTRWPAVAIGGAGLQIYAVWWAVTRLTPHARAWIATRRARVSSGATSVRPR